MRDKPKINEVARVVNSLFLNSDYQGKDWESVRKHLIIEVDDLVNRAKTIHYKDQYTPIIIKDDVDNEYMLINKYEATMITSVLKKLAKDGWSYNTGDWFSDIPNRVDKWLNEPTKELPDDQH
jgi:hypothetical protein